MQSASVASKCLGARLSTRNAAGSANPFSVHGAPRSPSNVPLPYSPSHEDRGHYRL
ncbi:hypothetical protein L210DRAFT_3120442 [Boletus edulis BED1]|uniref:Uncharacterized protein n=1 Tax=Boletus edulis BED1 TaxID=1328754 RepID=A0AAD4BGY7_BOLED|nr:hypothetical protein L210DRAFT_3120442 [Boletus edulis BED1]